MVTPKRKVAAHSRLPPRSCHLIRRDGRRPVSRSCRNQTFWGIYWTGGLMHVHATGQMQTCGYLIARPQNEALMTLWEWLKRRSAYTSNRPTKLSKSQRKCMHCGSITALSGIACVERSEIVGFVCRSCIENIHFTPGDALKHRRDVNAH